MSQLSRSKKLAGNILRKIDDAAQQNRLARENERLRQILDDPAPPAPLDSEEVFATLQNRFPPMPEYGYDAYSLWKRGAERTLEMLESTESLRSPGARILEAGCGDGMTGAVLAHFGHQVTLLDMEDWRDARARGLPFTSASLCSPPQLAPESFDFICSFNTFEHIPNPKSALDELLRLCRPGGRIYLHFGPLYWSPWGLHAYRSLRMPYPQILFSMQFIEEKLKQIGISDLGRKRESLQPLNGLRFSEYQQIWRQSGCRIVVDDTFKVRDHLNLVFQFPLAFRGRQLSVDDLATQAIRILLEKPA